jgi:hypothetical protein
MAFRLPVILTLLACAGCAFSPAPPPGQGIDLRLDLDHGGEALMDSRIQAWRGREVAFIAAPGNDGSALRARLTGDFERGGPTYSGILRLDRVAPTAEGEWETVRDLGEWKLQPRLSGVWQFQVDDPDGPVLDVIVDMREPFDDRSARRFGYR